MVLFFSVYRLVGEIYLFLDRGNVEWVALGWGVLRLGIYGGLFYLVGGFSREDRLEVVIFKIRFLNWVVCSVLELGVFVL